MANVYLLVMTYLFTATIFYAVAIIFGTAAARNLSPTLSAGLSNLLAAIIPLSLALPLLTKKEFGDHKFGVTMALASGICIAIFAIALNKSFAMNKVSIVAPIVFGGAIFVSTLLAFFVFKERITPVESVGLAFLALGLGIVVYARVTTS